MKISPHSFAVQLGSEGVDVTRYCDQIQTSPKRPSPNALQYLDADIEETYTEAEENRIDKRIRSAATGYRTVLELAMNKIAPDIKGNLFERLGKLQDANKLPAEMTDWAHNIRIFGNEAVHEGAKASPEDVEDLANITKIILIYLFEMPERVRLMRERKSE